MPNNRDPFNAGVYYHIYNRGYLKNKIFYGQKDYKRFVKKLTKYVHIYEDFLSVELYCLLPNHFHLLIKNKKKGLELANFMRRLQVSHALYFNKKYGGIPGSRHEGVVFADRYKAKEIDTLKYLKDVKKYIIENPVKHGYVNYNDEWLWSGGLFLDQDRSGNLET